MWNVLCNMFKLCKPVLAFSDNSHLRTVLFRFSHKLTLPLPAMAMKAMKAMKAEAGKPKTSMKKRKTLKKGISTPEKAKAASSPSLPSSKAHTRRDSPVTTITAQSISVMDSVLDSMGSMSPPVTPRKPDEDLSPVIGLPLPGYTDTDEESGESGEFELVIEGLGEL